jgi:hypothetical protein
MRWVSSITGESHTAFVRIAAHTLVTTDCSYRFAAFRGLGDDADTVGASLLAKAVGQQR